MVILESYAWIYFLFDILSGQAMLISRTTASVSANYQQNISRSLQGDKNMAPC